MPRITEKRFMGQVVTLARLRGWKTYHTYSSIHSAAGFPDLVLCRPGRALFVELKRQDGRVTADQLVWLETLKVAGLDARLWRPSDWDEIEEVLNGRDTPGA